MDHELVRLSKILSLALRHDPGKFGLQLDSGGWAGLDEMVDALRRSGIPISRSKVVEVVAQNDKRRFVLSGDRIRANQGHSIAVDLELPRSTPPERLFHGTARRNLPSIRRDGIQSMGRRFVHLSADEPTAYTVGARHGRSVVIEIEAGRMHRDGNEFYLSENGVWLTASVLPSYCIIDDDAEHE